MVQLFLQAIVGGFLPVGNAAFLCKLLQFRLDLAVLGRPELAQCGFKLLHQIVSGHFFLI